MVKPKTKQSKQNNTTTRAVPLREQFRAVDENQQVGSEIGSPRDDASSINDDEFPPPPLQGSSDDSFSGYGDEEGEILPENDPRNYAPFVDYAAAARSATTPPSSTVPTTATANPAVINTVTSTIKRINDLTKNFTAKVNDAYHELESMEIALGKQHVANLDLQAVFSNSVIDLLPRVIKSDDKPRPALQQKLAATGLSDWRLLPTKDIVEVVKQCLHTSESARESKNEVLDNAAKIKLTANFPNPNQLWVMEARVHAAIANTYGEDFRTHPVYNQVFQKQIYESMISKGLGDNELAMRLAVIAKREKQQIISNPNPLDCFFDLENKLIESVDNALKIVKETYPSVFPQIKSLIEKGTPKESTNSNPTPKGVKRDYDGKPKPATTAPAATKATEKAKVKSPCNICGHSHVDANVRCFWFEHPNKNKEYKTVEFAQSKAGIAYHTKFNKTALQTTVIDGSTFDLKAAKEKFKVKGNCKITCNCTDCIVNNNSTLITNDNNNHKYIFSTPSNSHLLPSTIKVNNKLLPIESFIDTGTLGFGEEANFISEKIFNLIKQEDTNIKINNKHIKICSDIIPNCTDSLFNSSVQFCFHNDVNKEMEIINIPVFILKNATYDLLLGRETIIKHKLLSKLANHFNAEGCKSTSSKVPLLDSSIDERRHESFAIVNSSSYSTPLPQQRLGELIRKSDLLDEEFREVIDDEIDEHELPIISDEVKDETNLVTILGSDYLQGKLRILVKEFADIFSTTVPSQPSKLNPLILEIDKSKWCTKTNQGPPRMQSYQKEQEIIKQIKAYLNLNVIQKSNSNYYSQILMVPKPGVNNWRFCLDLRNLNKATQPMGSVLPSIQQMLIRIGMKKPKYFSKFDLTSGYFQCSLAEGSKDYTSFTSSIGIYKWNRVTMGLMNAAGHYHNEISNNVLVGLIYNIVELYIDDIFVTTHDSEDKHVEDVRQVLLRFRKYSLKINPSKSILGDNNAIFCGHKCTSEGISFDREKLNLVEDFPTPTTHEDLKRFIGLANYFRDNIKNHSIMAEPLNKLLSNYDKRKKLPIIWNDTTISAYNQLKRSIINCPQLFYIKEGKQYLLILECDASDKRGLGGYLKQVELDENKNIINEFPIAFVSKGWSDAELNWAIPEKETFAIYYCMKKLAYILNDVYFIVRTDHKNITYLNFENNQKVKRWKMNVQTFNFDVEYIKGENNIVADAWSRLPAIKKYTTVFSNTCRLEDDNTSDYIDINTAYRYSVKPTPISLQHDGIVWCNSLRMHSNAISTKNNNSLDDQNDDDDSDDEDQFNHINIPASHFNDLLQVHNHNVGHASIDLTYHRLIILHTDKWLTKKRFVKKFVKHCPFCMKMREIKPKIHSSPFVLSTYNMFERVAFDTIGPLNESEDNHKYILVLICTFSRWVHLFALKRLTAKEAAEKLIQYIGIYGTPKQFLSDRGTQFKNEVFAELTRLLGVDHQFSTAYSSEENGIVERVNKEVMNRLRAFIFHKKFLYNWNTTDLPLTQRLLNSKVHSRLGTTPASLVMPAVNLDRNIVVQINGRKLNINGNVNINNIIPNDQFDYKYLAKHIKERYDELYSLAKETLLLIDNKHINDYPLQQTPFPSGSFVLVSFKSKNHPQKVNTRLRGPLKIINQSGLNTFNLKNLVNGRIETYNRQDLIPFEIDITQYDPAQIALSDHLGLLEIESVISHKPARPKKASDLSFVVKWVGYEDENDRTIEHWNTNVTLRKNKVILRYLRDKGMKQFIPKNIEIDKDEFSSDDDLDK